MSLAHSGGVGRRLKRLPYDINLWRYLLPSVEKSSMRDHYSFSALTAPPPPRRRRFAAVLAAMAWNLNACTSSPATPQTRCATRAPHSRAPQRHTPASWLSEARRNSVKKSERQRRCRWLRLQQRWRERVKRFQVQLQASKRMPAPLGGMARRVAWRAAVAQAEHAVHEQCIQSTLSRP